MKYTEIKARTIRVDLDGSIVKAFTRLLKSIGEAFTGFCDALRSCFEIVYYAPGGTKTENIKGVILYGN